MAEVVVVGAGLGGLATAARLAKLGHRVTVCERGDAPGGLLRQVHSGGLTWDATPFRTTIPAVLRDLFRKSGRPLERYVDLELATPARRHVFADGATLDLPTGSRGAQLDAVSERLGPAAGAAWTRLVDGQADVWALLRSDVLDPSDGVAALGGRRLRRALTLHRSLARHLEHELTGDARLQQLAAYSVERTGARTDDQPGLRAVEPYVERTFGVWRAAGGAGALAGALMQRMAERSVQVRFDTEVASLGLTSDRVTGVELADGSVLPADLVVTAVSPRQVFERLLEHPLAPKAAALFRDDARAAPGTVTYLEIEAGATYPGPALPADVVLHGDPLVTLTTDGEVSRGPGDSGDRRAWTVVSWAASPADPLATMAERGLDLRHLVAARHDQPVEPPVTVWSGPRDAVRRAALTEPLPGLCCLGTALLLGPSVPYVAWQAAHVAERLGRA